MSSGKMFSLNGVATGVSAGGSVSAYANFAALPAIAPDGSVAITTDTYTIYAYDLLTTTWQPEANPATVFTIGTFDSGTPGAKGATLSAAGFNSIIFQSASNTLPGMVNITTQTFKGVKTFTDGIVSAVTGNVTGNVSGNAGTVTTNANLTGMVTSVGNATTVVTNANLTGPVTSVGNATAIANGAISNAMLANSAVANLSGTNTGDQTNIPGNAATVTTNANLTGPVTSVGNATAIANNAITQAMTGATATATASKTASWDANVNLSTNNLLEGYTTTATAAGTTTIAVGSTYAQYFTGTQAQNCKLPVTSTLVLGQSFLVKNNSTGLVTIQSSGTNTVQVMHPGSIAIVECILTSGTTAASWDVTYIPAPLVVVADTAISGTYTPPANKRQVNKVHGNGGAVTLTDLGVTNAQSGDELILHGQDNTNTVTLGSGTNTVTNGSIILAQDVIISFYFDGTKWQEMSRNI